jgi:quercetin dioxygenase-like cupin family protein
MNHPLVLDRSRFARLDGPRHLQVTHGTLWLTIDHDPDDHVLTRGQAIDLPAGAQALLQALDAPARACVETVPPWWQRAARALRVGLAGARR